MKLLKTILVTLILFSLSATLTAQQADSSNIYEQPERLIQELKNNGALIVRLPSKQVTIDAYRNAGQEDVAKKIEEETLAQNQEIYKGYQEYFDFCPVYFIWTDDTDFILAGEKQGYFLNSDLQTDESISFQQDFYLFVDRGPVYEERDGVITGTPTENNALVIKTPQLKQIGSPFPFYNSLPINWRDMDAGGKRMQKKLSKYYDKVVD